MEIKEVPLSKSSLGELLRLNALCFNNPYSEKVLLSRLQGKEHWIYFAEENGKNIGFLVWYAEENNSYCWLLGVAPGFRRKGIGLALLRQQESAAREVGFKKIIVKTHMQLAKMINLLTSHGYTETKREKGHWGDEREAVFFEKQLED